MTEAPNTSGLDSASKRERGATGIHRLELSEAIKVAEAVYELGQGDPVASALVLTHLGRATTGGTSNTLLGASNTYGLTTSSKSKLALTDMGLKIASATSQDQKRLLALELLFTNELFTSVHTKYLDKTLPPVDDVAIDNLIRSYGLSESDAKVFWKVTKMNLINFGLTQEVSGGKQLVVSREKIVRSIDPDQSSSSSQSKLNDPVATPLAPNSQDKIDPSRSIRDPEILTGDLLKPEFHFNIQIHLPSDAEPEKYNSIFKSIAKHLLGRVDD